MKPPSMEHAYASWRKMFVSQPPVTAVEALLDLQNDETDDLDFPIFHVLNGVTV